MITLEIWHPLFSKSRPRVANGRAYMPKVYRDNQKELLAKIKAQYDGPPLEGPLRVELELFGEGRADIDNITGALFDVANKVLWVDDRVSIIPELEVSWTKASKKDSLWRIRIYQLETRKHQDLKGFEEEQPRLFFESEWPSGGM